MNKKENCQNSSEREQHIEVKRTVNQKSTSQKKVNQKSTSQKKVNQKSMSQEKANQKSMSQKKANQSGEKSVYDENRDALQERVEEKQWKKKQCNGLQHSDDEEKQKVIDSIMKVSRDNGFDDAYLQQHSDCSASSIKRFHSAWMGKRMSNWTTIFNLAHCVSVNCVFAENLVGMLVVIIMFLIRDAGIVSYHIDSTRKVVIEINFGKDKLLRMKDEEKNEKGKEGKDDEHL